MRNDKQISRLDSAPSKQIETSNPTTGAEPRSGELSTEELEERIAPMKKAYRF